MSPVSLAARAAARDGPSPASTYPRALYKALVAVGFDMPLTGGILVTVADGDKAEALPLIEGFAALGFPIYATGGTALFLSQNGVANVQTARKISEGTPNLLDLIHGGKIGLLINTISKDKKIEREGATIRRASVERGVPCLTSLDTARALLLALSSHPTADEGLGVRTVDEYLAG